MSYEYGSTLDNNGDLIIFTNNHENATYLASRYSLDMWYTSLNAFGKKMFAVTNATPEQHEEWGTQNWIRMNS